MPVGPDPSKMRTWIASSGFLSTSAQFVGVEGNNVLLRRLGGILLRVPRENLSLQDLAYVETIIETDSEDNTYSDSMQSEEQG